MAVLFTNNAASTLASGISSGATSLSVATGAGALFPSPSGGDFFYATLVDASNNIEIVKCTARSVDTMTVVRAQEGTTARSYSTGDKFELRTTAAGLNSKFDKTGGPISGAVTLSTNNSLLSFTDTHGGHPNFICQSNDDFVFWGTKTDGTGRAIWACQQSNDTSSLRLLVSAVGVTPAIGDNSSNLATTAFVATSYAPLVSPALAGVPTAPTAPVDTATTQLATTAFVDQLRDVPRVGAGWARGKMLGAATDVTLPAGYASGTTFSLYNDSAAAIAVLAGSGLTLRLAGTTTTGNRTLAAHGMATIWFNSPSEAIISGPGLT